MVKIYDNVEKRQQKSSLKEHYPTILRHKTEFLRHLIKFLGYLITNNFFIFADVSDLNMIKEYIIAKNN